MLVKTATFIRTMLTDRVGHLASHIKTAPAPLIPAALTELENTAAALIDFSRSSDTPDDADTAHAFTALTAIEDHVEEIRQLDDFFEKGSGKGSKTHQFVRRLRVIAELKEPVELKEPIQD